MKKMRTITVAVSALAITLALAGCSNAMGGMDMGGGSSPTFAADSAAVFNDADVAFAMQMVVHHQQAVEMAQMILDKPDIDPRVTELAGNIKAAQQPEIDTMNSWLSAWGVSTDMTGMAMEGTMSAEDMAALTASTGLEASRLFLEQMTVHHNGAIAMATVETQTGQNPDAIALAEKIIADQTAEIAIMKDILATL